MKYGKMTMVFALLGCSAFGQISTSSWVSAESGNWNTAENWNNGVPDGKALFVTNVSAPNVVISVTEAPATPFLGGTLRSNNNLTLEVGALLEYIDNPLYIRDGSTVRVKTGGTLRNAGTTTSPITRIFNGGTLCADGGFIDFSNIPKGKSAMVWIGDDTTIGYLNITNGGSMVFSGMSDPVLGTNTAPQMFVAYGGGAARGEINLHDGTLIINNPNSGATGLILANNTKSYAAMTMTGNSACGVSNWVTVGEGNGSTGILTIAGNSVFSHYRGATRFQVAAGKTGATGIVNVRENGILKLLNVPNAQGQDGLNLGGLGNDNYGLLSVDDNGQAICGSGITVGRGGSGGKTGRGEIILNSGTIALGESGSRYGLTLGWTGDSNCVARAKLTMNGGLMRTDSGVWNGVDQMQGIVVGRVSTRTGAALAEYYMNGGIVTNYGQFAVGAGLGATGSVRQTGGIIRNFNRPFSVGNGGGFGTLVIDGGTITNTVKAFIGGLTAADYGYTPTVSHLFLSNSVGQVTINDGALLSSQDLTLGKWGTGELTIGTNGFCTARVVSLMNTATNGQQSVLKFVLGSESSGKLTATQSVTLETGAKLIVDARNYKAKDPWVKLLETPARTGSFAPADITVLGPGQIVQTRDANIWYNDNARGTKILLF